MDHKYIAKQVQFIRRITALQKPESPALVDNALWRIASNADFPDLDPHGTLTAEQKTKVLNLLFDPATTPLLQAALEELEQGQGQTDQPDQFNNFNNGAN